MRTAPGCTIGSSSALGTPEASKKGMPLNSAAAVQPGWEASSKSRAYVLGPGGERLARRSLILGERTRRHGFCSGRRPLCSQDPWSVWNSPQKTVQHAQGASNLHVQD